MSADSPSLDDLQIQAGINASLIEKLLDEHRPYGYGLGVIACTCIPYQKRISSDPTPQADEGKEYLQHISSVLGDALAQPRPAETADKFNAETGACMCTRFDIANHSGEPCLDCGHAPHWHRKFCGAIR